MAKPTLGLPPKLMAADAAPKIPAPYLGASVVVLTAIKIAGQNEHAAIVTRVHSDDIVNVMLLPAEGQAYPIASINRAGSPSWRWPRN
jgi:hypothetical protein